MSSRGGVPDFLADTDDAGKTPLDPDEADGLLADQIDTRGALNAWEQANILRGQEWAYGRRGRPVLTVSYAQELHRRMFSDTWVWAGQFRRSGKTIGIDWTLIPSSVRDVLDNASYWMEHRTYPVDEATARLHHQLVCVHPFPNGNGRHARLLVEVLQWNLGLEPFSWGRHNSAGPGQARVQYISALKQADQGDIAPLLSFVRS